MSPAPGLPNKVLFCHLSVFTLLDAWISYFGVRLGGLWGDLVSLVLAAGCVSSRSTGFLLRGLREGRVRPVREVFHVFASPTVFSPNCVWSSFPDFWSLELEIGLNIGKIVRFEGKRRGRKGI